MAQVKKFASLERRIMDYIGKKYPLSPLQENFTGYRGHPSQRMLKMVEEEKRLFQILSRLPNFGVGRLLVDGKEKGNFWRVTGVQVDHTIENLDYGVAFGIYTERGFCTGYQQEIPQVNEHKWRLVPKIEEQSYLDYKMHEMDNLQLPLYVRYPPLLERMIKAQELKENESNSSTKEADSSEETDSSNEADNTEPMLRLLIKRHPFQQAKQEVDGKLL